LPTVCCEGWRLFWRPIKLIFLSSVLFFFWYHSPNFLYTPLTVGYSSQSTKDTAYSEILHVADKVIKENEFPLEDLSGVCTDRKSEGLHWKIARIESTYILSTAKFIAKPLLGCRCNIESPLNSSIRGISGFCQIHSCRRIHWFSVCGWPRPEKIGKLKK
jgi:hypothetical protein